MSSGKAWVMGMADMQKKQESLKEQMRKKHLRIMKNRKEFGKIFGTDVSKFYSNVFLGFDVVGFDEWLISQDEEYRKANAGEMGEDVDCSMATHIAKKYGQEAADLIKSFI